MSDVRKKILEKVSQLREDFKRDFTSKTSVGEQASLIQEVEDLIKESPNIFGIPAETVATEAGILQALAHINALQTSDAEKADAKKKLFKLFALYDFLVVSKLALDEIEITIPNYKSKDHLPLKISTVSEQNKFVVALEITFPIFLKLANGLIPSVSLPSEDDCKKSNDAISTFFKSANYNPKQITSFFINFLTKYSYKNTIVVGFGERPPENQVNSLLTTIYLNKNILSEIYELTKAESDPLTALQTYWKDDISIQATYDKLKAEKQKQAEAEKQKQAEAEKQKQAEAEKQKQAEAEKQKQLKKDQNIEQTRYQEVLTRLATVQNLIEEPSNLTYEKFFPADSQNIIAKANASIAQRTTQALKDYVEFIRKELTKDQNRDNKQLTQENEQVNKACDDFLAGLNEKLSKAEQDAVEEDEVEEDVATEEHEDEEDEVEEEGVGQDAVEEESEITRDEWGVRREGDAVLIYDGEITDTWGSAQSKYYYFIAPDIKEVYSRHAFDKGVYTFIHELKQEMPDEAGDATLGYVIPNIRNAVALSLDLKQRYIDLLQEKGILFQTFDRNTQNFDDYIAASVIQRGFIEKGGHAREQLLRTRNSEDMSIDEILFELGREIAIILEYAYMENEMNDDLLNDADLSEEANMELSSKNIQETIVQIPATPSESMIGVVVPNVSVTITTQTPTTERIIESTKDVTQETSSEDAEKTTTKRTSSEKTSNKAAKPTESKPSDTKTATKTITKEVTKEAVAPYTATLKPCLEAPALVEVLFSESSDGKPFTGMMLTCKEVGLLTNGLLTLDVSNDLVTKKGISKNVKSLEKTLAEIFGAQVSADLVNTDNLKGINTSKGLYASFKAYTEIIGGGLENVKDTQAYKILMFKSQYSGQALSKAIAEASSGSIQTKSFAEMNTRFATAQIVYPHMFAFYLDAIGKIVQINGSMLGQSNNGLPSFAMLSHDVATHNPFRKNTKIDESALLWRTVIERDKATNKNTEKTKIKEIELTQELKDTTYFNLFNKPLLDMPNKTFAELLSDIKDRTQEQIRWILEQKAENRSPTLARPHSISGSHDLIKGIIKQAEDLDGAFIKGIITIQETLKANGLEILDDGGTLESKTILHINLKTVSGTKYAEFRFYVLWNVDDVNLSVWQGLVGSLSQDQELEVEITEPNVMTEIPITYLLGESHSANIGSMNTKLFVFGYKGTTADNTVKADTLATYLFPLNDYFREGLVGNESALSFKKPFSNDEKKKQDYLITQESFGVDQIPLAQIDRVCMNFKLDDFLNAISVDPQVSTHLSYDNMLFKYINAQKDNPNKEYFEKTLFANGYLTMTTNGVMNFVESVHTFDRMPILHTLAKEQEDGGESEE